MLDFWSDGAVRRMLNRIEGHKCRLCFADADVTGGKATSPLWTSQVSTIGFKDALEVSLKNVGLFASYQQADYRLTAHLEALKQPVLGVSMTVTARVNYTLHEAASGKTVYAKSIELPYTAAFGDALLGSERLRLANEGAIRVNVEALLNDLFALQIEPVKVSLTK